jgi:hypothetical protein
MANDFASLSSGNLTELCAAPRFLSRARSGYPVGKSERGGKALMGDIDGAISAAPADAENIRGNEWY